MMLWRPSLFLCETRSTDGVLASTHGIMTSPRTQTAIRNIKATVWRAELNAPDETSRAWKVHPTPAISLHSTYSKPRRVLSGYYKGF